MDIEEFEKSVAPKAKRSRLEPFQSQIFELKSKGYANWQVSEWLAANGVKVSQEAVRKFIKSREGNAVPNTTSGAADKAPAAPVEGKKEPGNSVKTETGGNNESAENVVKIGKFEVEKPKTFEHNPNANKDELF